MPSVRLVSVVFTFLGHCVRGVRSEIGEGLGLGRRVLMLGGLVEFESGERTGLCGANATVWEAGVKCRPGYARWLIEDIDEFISGESGG